MSVSLESGSVFTGRDVSTLPDSENSDSRVRLKKLQNKACMARRTQSKSQYSELEAAAELGISVEELRALVRSQIASDDALRPPLDQFHPADLLLLRILVKSHGSNPAGSTRLF